MRILMLHADSFSYKVTGQTAITKQLDPIPEDLLGGRLTRSSWSA